MKHIYGLQFRPASIGAAPCGPFEVQERLSDPEAARYTRHGVIVYDRPLDESEIRSFELVVLADDHLREELAIEMALALQDYADGYLEIWADSPSDFAIMVISRLPDLRRYAIYPGDKLTFARMVAARLEALVANTNGGA